MRASTSVLLICLLGACAADQPTQVLVWFDIEESSALEARATSARVRVFDADGFTVLDETRPLGEGRSAVTLPASISLLPREPDERNRFRAEVELLDGSDAVLALQRAEGVFSPNRLWEVHLRFSDACLEVECGFGDTCVEGACARACFVPEEPQPAPCACHCPCAGDGCVDGFCEPTSPVVELSAGPAHACAIVEGGQLLCWGSNGSGQLGVGDSEGRDLPTPVELPDAVAAVSAGWRHTCAVLADGSLYCWGDNDSGQLGVEGPGTRTPLRVTGPEGSAFGDVSLVAAGELHTCIVIGDGTVWCWGDNEFGQVGTGAMGAEVLPPSPVLTSGSMEGTKIALEAGFGHTCALQAIGRLWCWGRNFDGNLGLGDTDHRAQPERVLLSADSSDEPVWTDLTIGNGWHTCALADGQVYCFGDATDGRLGFASESKVSTPTLVPALVDIEHAAVGAGLRHTCAIAGDGSLRCFGTSPSGELGVGETPESQRGPVRLADAGWERLALGESFSCGVRRGGAMYCWGTNDAGQLALGDREGRNVPVRVCLP